MLRGYFIFIFMISLFAVPHPLWAQTGQCPAVFQVTKKQEDVVLGHGTVNIPKTHTLILKSHDHANRFPALHPVATEVFQPRLPS